MSHLDVASQSLAQGAQQSPVCLAARLPAAGRKAHASSNLGKALISIFRIIAIIKALPPAYKEHGGGGGLVARLGYIRTMPSINAISHESP